MGTKAAIGLRLNNGQVRAVTCHYDGYPSHAMPVLAEHFNSVMGACALIEPGNMKSLGKEPEYVDSPEYAETINRFSVIQHWQNRGCDYLYVYEGDDQGWVHTDLRDFD